MSKPNTTKVTIGDTNLSGKKLSIARGAIISAVQDLEPKTAASKKRSRKREDDDLDTIASRIVASYNTIHERYKGKGTEWEAWHCFVGTDLVYAVRQREYVKAEITGGNVLQERKLSLFMFRSCSTTVQDNLRKKSKPDENILHNIDPDPDHMDRTQISKVRTDMDSAMYNTFESVCRIAMAKKNVQNRQDEVSSTPSSSSSSFADAARYIRSRLEMMEVFGGEWHVVAAKANKGELSGARACSANIDASASRVTIVTGGGVRIFAFQHADNSANGDGCIATMTEFMTTKSRSVSYLIMFVLMGTYFFLGNMEALQCSDNNFDVVAIVCTER